MALRLSNTRRLSHFLLLVTILFLIVIFLIFIRLPDLTSIPSGESIAASMGRVNYRHGNVKDEEDVHLSMDKKELWRKIVMDKVTEQQKIHTELQQALKEVVQLQQQAKEKQRVIQERRVIGEMLASQWNMTGQSQVSRSELQGGEPANETLRMMRNTVKEMMRLAWKGYTTYAWGLNELRPETQTGHSSLVLGAHPLGATIVDSMDTLYIMGLNEEFKKARDWVAEKLDFDVAVEVSVFEYNIRFLGGLLSVYVFTKDPVFLEKAKSLALHLLPAFNTPNGLPNALINLKTKHSRNYHWAGAGCAILSEFGTLHMEMAFLSELTGDPVFLKKVERIRRIISQTNRPEGVFPNYLNPHSLSWCTQHASLAGLGDSFYEYLLKEWVRSGSKDVEARKLYDLAMEGVERVMLKRSRGGHLYLADHRPPSVQMSTEKMDHLACFAGGMFVLGAYGADNATKWLQYGLEITATCRASYTSTHTQLGPEAFHFDRGVEAVAIQPNEKSYLLRPETVESYFYMWRYTKDPKYREWAWEVVQALEKYCKTANGYSGIRDVYSVTPSRDDVQQSYFLAETLKYLYLIFSEDSLLPLSRWVFNTEAHPLPIKGSVDLALPPVR